MAGSVSGTGSTKAVARRILLAFISGLVFLAVFLPNYTYIINAFYYFGAPYLDAGSQANMLWHNDWNIPLPPPRGYGDDTPYSYVHFSPVLIAVNALSYLAPLPMVEFFAAFIAGIYASLALALFYALMVASNARSWWKTALFAFMAVGFAFNGIVMQGIWMPHVEYYVPLVIFLFLFHHARGRHRMAAVFFLLALLTREDTGFHITAVLGLVMVINYSRNFSVASVKPELCYIAVACAYSLGTFFLAKYNAFSDIYTGHPPYAHLNWHVIGGRLLIVATERPYIFTTAIATLIWTAWKKDWMMAVGFAAYIPWLVFNLTAANEDTGVLYAYYLFPMVLSLSWPVLAYSFNYGAALPETAKRDMIFFQMLIIACGLIGWNPKEHFYTTVEMGARWGSYLPKTSAGTRASVRSLVELLNSGPPEMGTIMIDSYVMNFTKTKERGAHLLMLTENVPADTIAYFNIPYSWQLPAIMKKVEENRMINSYCNYRSRVCLFSRFDILPALERAVAQKQGK